MKQADEKTITGTRHNKRSRPLRIFHGRMYFALQALAGAAWWLGTITVPALREATLGSLNPLLVAILDIPLFVIGSALAALFIRRAVWVAVAWTVLVAVCMVIYATVTTEAGLGAVLMVAAAVGSVIAGSLVLLGRIPSNLLLKGPFAFHSSRTRVRSQVLTRTMIQLVVFWGVFLIILPAIINSFEDRWNLSVKFPILVAVAGFALLAISSVIGVWSARAIANFGSGTPLHAAMANHLVVRGPYAFVRNPMAIAGIAQGVAIGLFIGSWMVIAYAIAGSLLWNWLIRPHEEADLRERFGAEFYEYATRVSCWVPNFSQSDSDADSSDVDSSEADPDEAEPSTTAQPTPGDQPTAGDQPDSAGRPNPAGHPDAPGRPKPGNGGVEAKRDR